MRANGRVCRKRPAPARLHRGGVLFSRQRNYHCRSLDPFGDVQSGGDILSEPWRIFLNKRHYIIEGITDIRRELVALPLPAGNATDADHEYCLIGFIDAGLDPACCVVCLC